ncbi:MAG: hypothetical protein ACI4WT_10730 [Oligosphaeraceae bacterium]
MERESRADCLASAFATFAVGAILMGGLVTACMSDEEYLLRKRQLENQARHPATYEPMSLEMRGPVKLELVDGSQLRVRVTAPGQPFREIPVPDGIRSQTDLVRHLVDIGAISVIGWKALDGAKGRTTNVTNHNAGAAQP